MGLHCFVANHSASVGCCTYAKTIFRSAQKFFGDTATAGPQTRQGSELIGPRSINEKCEKRVRKIRIRLKTLWPFAQLAFTSASPGLLSHVIRKAPGIVPVDDSQEFVLICNYTVKGGVRMTSSACSTSRIQQPA